MSGRAYLGAAGAAVFLALAAYGAADGMALAERPDTVTAEFVSVGESLDTEGNIVREEEYVCCDGHVKLTVSDGERVAKGAVLGTRGRRAIHSPAAGFFSSHVDEDAPENAVGRIVSSLSWTYETRLQSGTLSVGDTVTLRTELGDFAAVVCRTDGHGTGFRCHSGVNALLDADRLPAQVLCGEKSGFRVPASALRHDDDGDYVSVLAGSMTRRAAVSDYVELDDYCLVNGEIRQGMEIIY